MKIDPFYLIVDDVKWLEQLVPLGLKLVQLRIKNQTEAFVRQQIQKAKRICRAYPCQLIINDYWKLALEEQCDFVHLGQEDLETADLPALKRANIRLGISTHDREELERAISAVPDYIALGPIFPTILKKMKWQPQGIEKIKKWRAHIAPLPLVAIGGLTVERGIMALKAGAQSAAVVTDVLRHPEPQARTKAWLEATEPWRRPCS